MSTRILTATGEVHEVSKNIVRKIYENTLRAETTPEELTRIALPRDFTRYNDIIGLPISRITNKPAPLTWYQIEYHNDIQTYHHEIVNKTRKGAFTEAAIRSISLNCFDRYAGHDIIMAAGNDVDTIRQIMIRFDELFKDKRHPEDGDKKYAFRDLAGNRWTHNEIIRRFTKGSKLEMELPDDTRVFGFAVSKQGKRQSFRGPDDTIAVFLTEAAHMGMEDDSSVFSALEPNLANRVDGDLIYESTPNGQRGTYFDYCSDWKIAYGLQTVNTPFPTQKKENREMLKKRLDAFKKTGWNYREIPYTWALEAGVVSESYIDFQKKNPRIDFEQEYNTKFTTSKMAAFDELVPENYLDDSEKLIDMEAILRGEDISL